MTLETAQDHDKAVLLAELQHRVRNSLALTRSLVRISAETSDNLSDYVMHLESRLDAMSRVQGAFVRDPLGGIDLALMVADELESFGAREGDRVAIAGPTIPLHPRAAETFGLALHELATNAMDFGALTGSSGHIAVTWRVEEQHSGRHLLFDWVETGVAMASDTPLRRGFGRAILEDMLPYNLRARSTLTVGPQGVSYRTNVPLTDRVLHRG